MFYSRDISALRCVLWRHCCPQTGCAYIHVDCSLILKMKSRISKARYAYMYNGSATPNACFKTRASEFWAELIRCSIRASYAIYMDDKHQVFSKRIILRQGVFTRLRRCVKEFEPTHAAEWLRFNQKQWKFYDLYWYSSSHCFWNFPRRMSKEMIFWLTTLFDSLCQQ